MKAFIEIEISARLGHMDMGEFYNEDIIIRDDGLIDVKNNGLHEIGARERERCRAVTCREIGDTLWRVDIRIGDILPGLGLPWERMFTVCDEHALPGNPRLFIVSVEVQENTDGDHVRHLGFIDMHNAVEVDEPVEL